MFPSRLPRFPRSVLGSSLSLPPRPLRSPDGPRSAWTWSSAHLPPRRAKSSLSDESMWTFPSETSRSSLERALPLRRSTPRRWPSVACSVFCGETGFCGDFSNSRAPPPSRHPVLPRTRRHSSHRYGNPIPATPTRSTTTHASYSPAGSLGERLKTSALTWRYAAKQFPPLPRDAGDDGLDACATARPSTAVQPETRSTASDSYLAERTCGGAGSMTHGGWRPS